MKEHFILIHGFTGSPDGEFFPWLKQELENKGYLVEVPLLPDSDNPNIDKQAASVLEQVQLGGKITLVGHSLGCAVALKMIEKIHVPIHKLILAAGFVSPGFKDKKRPFEDTFDWKFDFEAIKKNTKSISILRAENDSAVPAERGDEIQAKIGGKIIDVLADDNHFCGEQEFSILHECLTD